jgi:hypothetical protein
MLRYVVENTASHLVHLSLAALTSLGKGTPPATPEAIFEWLNVGELA